MTTISLICTHCGASFNKSEKEHKRRLNLGKTEFFCSQKCSSTHRYPAVKATFAAARNDPANIAKLVARNQARKADPFNKFLHRAKKHGQFIAVTADDLRRVWHHQKGKCAYTGVVMTVERDPENPLIMASLDRIRSDVGYVIGNVQFVCYGINLAKNNATDTQFRRFMESFGAKPEPERRWRSNSIGVAHKRDEETGLTRDYTLEEKEEWKRQNPQSCTPRKPEPAFIVKLVYEDRTLTLGFGQPISIDVDVDQTTNALTDTAAKPSPPPNPNAETEVSTAG